MDIDFLSGGKKVGLALGSGGARGLAHIGVIEGLEEKGYTISQIAGCSAGSLVGAIYASGNLARFKEWIIDLDFWDVFSLMDFTMNSQGFLKGEKVLEEMEFFVGDKKIEELEVPFCAVATDLLRKEEIIFKSGNLYEAVRSSIAIPTVLQPMEINGKKYIDGGIVNPLPINHINENDVDLVIAVNLNSKAPYLPQPTFVSSSNTPKNNYEIQLNKVKDRVSGWFKKRSKKSKELGFFELLNNSFDLTQDSLTEFIIEKHNPDILVDISREACGTMEFYRAAEMIAAGRHALEEALN